MFGYLVEEEKKEEPNKMPSEEDNTKSSIPAIPEDKI